MLLTMPAPAASVTFEVTPLAAEVGGALVFAVWRLVEGDRFTATLTVAAEGPGILLAGPVLHASFAGVRVTQAGRDVVLFGPELPVEFLQPTPDADSADPPIAHRAALLDAAPAAIFAWVREATEHQVYVGSLHGARGALYGRAGNSVDRTNLLVALLRAAGIPAGYQVGTLTEVQAAQLYAELFPPDAWTDRGGTALTIADLRASPEDTLRWLAPQATDALGNTKAERLAAMAALGDAELETLVMETSDGASPDEIARLQQHVWASTLRVEAGARLDILAGTVLQSSQPGTIRQIHPAPMPCCT